MRGVDEVGRQRDSGPQSIGGALGPASALPTARAPAAGAKAFFFGFLGAAGWAQFFFFAAHHGRGSVRCKCPMKKQKSQPLTRLRVRFAKRIRFITRFVKSCS